MRALKIAAIVSIASATFCRADSPLAPPGRYTEKSPDGSIMAISDPKTSTTVFQNTTTKKVLWRLPSWERSLFVANDGKHVVVGYSGLNLIPQGYDEGMVLFTFWREGKKVREVTLKEFISNKSQPQKSASHYHWGSIEKIGPDGNLIVRDAQHKVSRYSLETGLELK